MASPDGDGVSVVPDDGSREGLARGIRSALGPLNDDNLPVVTLVRRLQAELAGVRVDAERYRYLRDEMPRPEHGQPVWLRRGDDLDESIDAAISGAAKDDKTFRGENESGSGIGDSHRRNGGGAA